VYLDWRIAHLLRALYEGSENGDRTLWNVN
jgi:hypothetical protein